MAEEPRTFQLGPIRSVRNEESPTGRRSAAPKSQSKPVATKGDVDKAIALLSTLYDAAGDGMDLFGLTETKAKWAEAVPKLQRINKDSLAASPKLAKSIASLGEGGGATTFFVMHVIIIAGVVPTARRELTESLSTRRARHAAEPENPGFTFGGMDADLSAAMEGETFPGGYNAGERIPGL